jgi:hypothetical protein
MIEFDRLTNEGVEMSENLKLDLVSSCMEAASRTPPAQRALSGKCHGCVDSGRHQSPQHTAA